MKLILSFFIIAYPYILFAQNSPSIYDKDGKVKSVEQRKLEESQNKQNTSSGSSSSSGSRTSAAFRKEVREVKKDIEKKKEDDKKKSLNDRLIGMNLINSFEYVGQSIHYNGLEKDTEYKLVSKDNKWGVISIVGGTLVSMQTHLIYDEIKYSYDLHLGVRVGNKWGFIDGNASEKVLLPIIYDELLSEYSIDDMKIVKDGKTYHINFKGEQIKHIVNTVIVKENFTLPEFGQFTDVRDNNVYKTTQQDQQTFMAQNLSARTFRNGDVIPLIESPEQWKKANDQHLPACCYYDNYPENGKNYGLLYNWYAVADARGLAPKGWHVPDNSEWDTLMYNIGEYSNAGKKMKATTGWGYSSGNDLSGFTALPSGYYNTYYALPYSDIGTSGFWWTSDEYNATEAVYRMLTVNNNSFQSHYADKRFGYSVRCIKD